MKRNLLNRRHVEIFFFPSILCTGMSYKYLNNIVLGNTLASNRLCIVIFTRYCRLVFCVDYHLCA